jgi:hypothetical protein
MYDIFFILLLIGFGLMTGAYFGYTKAACDFMNDRPLSKVVRDRLEQWFISNRELDNIIRICEKELENRIHESK